MTRANVLNAKPGAERQAARKSNAAMRRSKGLSVNRAGVKNKAMKAANKANNAPKSSKPKPAGGISGRLTGGARQTPRPSPAAGAMGGMGAAQGRWRSPGAGGGRWRPNGGQQGMGGGPAQIEGGTGGQRRPESAIGIGGALGGMLGGGQRRPESAIGRGPLGGLGGMLGGGQFRPPQPAQMQPFPARPESGIGAALGQGGGLGGMLGGKGGRGNIGGGPGMQRPQMGAGGGGIQRVAPEASPSWQMY